MHFGASSRRSNFRLPLASCRECGEEHTHTAARLISADERKDIGEGRKTAIMEVCGTTQVQRKGLKGLGSATDFRAANSPRPGDRQGAAMSTGL